VVRIGRSGSSYAHWRGILYPEKGSTASWLELYAQRYDTVEVNAPFYRLPTRVIVERWASRTPESYIRFHSGRGRNGVYTRSQVDEWAGRLAAFGGDVYASFNNDWEAFAVKNAEQLRDALGVVPEGARSQSALSALRRRTRRTPSLR
jgi:uncharacterized protein YecE (DUF72 family)